MQGEHGNDSSARGQASLTRWSRRCSSAKVARNPSPDAEPKTRPARRAKYPSRSAARSDWKPAVELLAFVVVLVLVLVLVLPVLGSEEEEVFHL